MSTQPSLPFDICRNRHRGNVESEESNTRIAFAKEILREKVFAFVASKREQGATCWEVHVAMGLPYTTCSARLSELRKEERLVKSGERRDTRNGEGSSAAVLVTPEWRKQ